MKTLGLMRCGATSVSSSANSNVGTMRCGAVAILTPEETAARDERKRLFELEEQKKAKKQLKELETELNVETETEQAENQKVAEVVEANGEKLDNNIESVGEVKLSDKHVLTLKKDALAKGYTGTKFDKVTLITFLEANQ